MQYKNVLKNKKSMSQKQNEKKMYFVSRKIKYKIAQSEDALRILSAYFVFFFFKFSNLKSADKLRFSHTVRERK